MCLANLIVMRPITFCTYTQLRVLCESSECLSSARAKQGEGEGGKDGSRTQQIPGADIGGPVRKNERQKSRERKQTEV